MKTQRQKEHAKYLASTEWAKVRADLLTLRGHKCERCHRTKGLHIHHLTYDNWMNEEADDLVILCREHHKLEHGMKSRFKKKKKKRKNRNIKKFKPVKYEMTEGEKMLKDKINELVHKGTPVSEAIKKVWSYANGGLNNGK